MVRARAWIWPACALVAVSVLGDCAASQHESSNDGVTTTSVSTAYTSGYQPSPCTCECCDGSVGSTDPECHGCASVCSERGGQFGVACDCVDMAETCASCEICARSSCEFEWYAMTEQPRYEQMQRCVDACAGSCPTSCVAACMAGDSRTMVTWRDYYRCMGCESEMCRTSCSDDDYFGPLIGWACGEGNSTCEGGAGGVAGAGVGGRGGAGG